jgi:hypothetical protein
MMQYRSKISHILLLFALVVGSSTAIANASVLSGSSDREALDWQITEIYLATMGYAPDAEGLGYWIKAIETDSSWDPTSVAMSFFDQPLVKAKYPDALGYSALIDALYQNVFNIQPDTEGKAYWLSQLESGTLQRSQMIIALIDGGWANQDSADVMATFGNRVKVGLAFAEYQQKNGIVYSDLTESEQSRLRQAGAEVMAGVTSDEATLQSALASVANFLVDLTEDRRGFVSPAITYASEEVVLIGAGYGPSGVVHDLSGYQSKVQQADLSSDGQTVWALTYDLGSADPLDNGWVLWIMDRSGLNPVRKPLATDAVISDWPEVAIADKFGAFGYVSLPFWGDDGRRHWRFYSTHWDADSTLLQKIDTFEAAQRDPDFPANEFINYAPVSLRALDGGSGFYFLNGPKIYGANESSPGSPIELDSTQNLRWNGEPPPASSHWGGLDVGGGRWISTLALSAREKAVVVGELLGTVHTIEFAEDLGTYGDAWSEISDDGEVTSYCVYDSPDDSRHCWVGERGDQHRSIDPNMPGYETWRVGLSGNGQRIWCREAGFNAPGYTYIANADGTERHRAGSLANYDSPVLDEDGDTFMGITIYGDGIQNRTGLSIVSIGQGLVQGPMPRLSDLRYKLTSSSIEIEVVGNEEVASVRAAALRDGYANPSNFENSPYRNLDVGQGAWLTAGENRRFTLTDSLYGEPGANDTLRLTAFNKDGNRITHIEARLDSTE